MTKIKLGIQKHCEANWENMQAVPTGRFCSSCTKTVVDFTEKTDQEILDYFINYGENSFCSRIYTDQVPRFSLDDKVYRFPKLLKQVAAVALLGISMTGMPVLLHGQSTISPEILDKSQTQAHDRVIVVEVPAEYETIEVQKLVKPAELVVDTIPAEYQTVKSRRLVRMGGFSDFREISCIAPREEITVEIKLLKEKLKERGYFNGEIDNVVTEDLKESLIKFRTDNKMPPTFELDDGALYLLGFIDSFDPIKKDEVHTGPSLHNRH